MQRIVFAALITLLLGILLLLTVPLGEQARLVPLAVVVPTLLLAGVQLLREWRAPQHHSIVSPETDSSACQELYAVGWVLAAPLLITLFGLQLGAPLYLFLFLKIRGRESLRFALIAALALVTGIHALSMIVSPLMIATMFAAFTQDGVCFYAQGVPFAVSMALIAPGFSCLSVAQYRPGRERDT